jgi:hypothetical protein
MLIPLSKKEIKTFFCIFSVLLCGILPFISAQYLLIGKHRPRSFLQQKPSAIFMSNKKLSTMTPDFTLSIFAPTEISASQNDYYDFTYCHIQPVAALIVLRTALALL